MQILKEFLASNLDEDIKKSISVILGFYKNNKKLIAISEQEDFQQDIILTVLEAKANYIKDKGSFATYLVWCFKTLKQHIISKYTGVRMNYYQYMNNFKKDKAPLKIYSLEGRQ